MDFSSHISPVYNDQRGERIAAGNGEDVDEGFLGHRHTDGIARVVQQRVVFPVTGNPHVIHKQGGRPRKTDSSAW